MAKSLFLLFLLLAVLLPLSPAPAATCRVRTHSTAAAVTPAAHRPLRHARPAGELFWSLVLLFFVIVIFPPSLFIVLQIIQNGFHGLEGKNGSRAFYFVCLSLFFAAAAVWVAAIVLLCLSMTQLALLLYLCIFGAGLLTLLADAFFGPRDQAGNL